MKPINISLGAALGLRPLDRVQINNRREINEMRLGAQQGRADADLPFWYFQRVVDDGRIEVRTPSGYTTVVDALDICDVLPGVPVVVRAIPRSVFLERLKLTPGERQAPAPPECYSEAYVLNITKDRWGRVDMVSLLFKDDALNAGGPWNGPVHLEDRPALEAKGNRTWMPVMGAVRGQANYSADKGVAASKDLARTAASRFIQSAVRGQTHVVSAIAQSGVDPLSRAALNRLVPPMAP